MFVSCILSYDDFFAFLSFSYISVVRLLAASRPLCHYVYQILVIVVVVVVVVVAVVFSLKVYLYRKTHQKEPTLCLRLIKRTHKPRGLSLRITIC